MQLGMIGLGRMGGNIVRRLMRHGHTTVVYDKNAQAVDEIAKEGAKGAGSLEELVKQLKPPRTVWVMLPAGRATEKTSRRWPNYEPCDVIIDGGNSFWQDDIRRAKAVAAQASTMSMPEPAAAFGASSAATA